ncbi:hypothetical protein N7468_000503 [Penicillium chermesinum]|uniref:Uncharacterized protein n=1 Tax=Penicillium chermesinum TaxID=63820 RepID=A0A9W9TYG9_9EURO|nr:uncharacterized protein N7468_000503 [Penicillium chermesinum]KAJ5249052.1 hypothetical protein N7468_000503 [Penicillium chermesinum]KAJ6151159.1 hypothetical protein N7470_007753 [Penicillium chermesinum]
MGNICSKSANKPDATASPGRVLGTSAQAQQNKASGGRVAPPKSTNWQATPGRTLGESSPDGPQGSSDEARSNAAIAAQKRAQTATTSTKGRLGSKLAAQKAKTQTQTLAEVSRDERAARDADQIAELRTGA